MLHLATGRWRAGRRRSLRALALAAVVLALAAISIAASAGLSITRHTAAGGSAIVSAGRFRLGASAGIAAAGLVSSGDTSIRSGFWLPVASTPPRPTATPTATATATAITTATPSGVYLPLVE